jgi:hypothetical protein
VKLQVKKFSRRCTQGQLRQASLLETLLQTPNIGHFSSAKQGLTSDSPCSTSFSGWFFRDGSLSLQIVSALPQPCSHFVRVAARERPAHRALYGGGENVRFRYPLSTFRSKFTLEYATMHGIRLPYEETGSFEIGNDRLHRLRRDEGGARQSRIRDARLKLDSGKHCILWRREAQRPQDFI